MLGVSGKGGNMRRMSLVSCFLIVGLLSLFVLSGVSNA